MIMLPKFNRTAQACHKKFNQFFFVYKEDKLANGISCNNQQESKFYDALDQWYHQAGQCFKHVSATTNDSADFPTNYSPSISKTKVHFRKKSIKIFEKMAETNIGLMNFFERTNELLKKVDYQFDHLINKL